MIAVEGRRLLPMPHGSLTDTMTTRGAVILTIGLIASLMVAVAIAAMFAGDISERVVGIVTTVLGSMATVLAGLLLFLRVETVNTKVDEAALQAAVAARKAAEAASKVEQVHHDVLNGPMRRNIKQAISEAEADPEVRQRRIENVARGVQEDRHATGSREQAAYARGVLDAQKRWQQQHTEDGS